MRVAIIENGIVLNVCEADSAWVAQHGGIVTDMAGPGWSYDGVAFTPPTPPPLTVTDITGAVQAKLDATARTRNYDNILSACSYATSTHQPFASEAQALVNWRDAVWLYCYAELAKVQAGTRTMPIDTASIISELPAAPW